ncbi:MAG: DUF4921 family protein [Propionibacteriaceae bacterium]|nr:DUF4921 family protein [Propionibacteriaceae bacterium]
MAKSTEVTMLFGYRPEPEYLTTMDDGTVKQLNPFTGVEVWTVAGRGKRPIATAVPQPEPLTDADNYCVFCPGRYAQTPPEKARVARSADGWETRANTLPADWWPAAEFRRIPNLFEILSYDYWHANYGYELPLALRDHMADYLALPEGWEHASAVIKSKLRAMGKTDDEIAAMDREALSAHAPSFFGSSHDVIVARRHFTDGATDNTALASSGTLSPEEHEQFIKFTVESARSLYAQNRYARYVAVFQNWLRPAGASIDHLHKQLVAIDEWGTQHQQAIAQLRSNPNIFNEAAVNYASYKNLIIAENEHAVAFAGFGHRYPTIEIFSKSASCDPWEHTPEELRSMSDLIHAMHAASGPGVSTNEEWHYRPIDSDMPQPWRVMLKWRISTLAGFEGATKIYLNTVDPYSLRDRVVSTLFDLRTGGAIAPGIRIATECECRPNPLRYADHRL